MIRFLWDNARLDDAIMTASSEVDSLPVSNLKDTIRKKVWKSAEGQSHIDIDFKANTIISSIGLVEHDLAYTSTVTIQGFANTNDGNEQNLDAAAAVDKTGGEVGVPVTGHGYSYGDLIFISGSLHYDGLYEVQDGTTTDEIVILSSYTEETFTSVMSVAGVVESLSETISAWDPVVGWGEGGWGELGWGGAPDDTFLERLPKITRAAFFTQSVARYWRVSFDNGTEPFKVGRLFLCRHFEPEVNFSYGWNITIVDPTKVSYSLSGQPWSDVKDQYYRVTFKMAHLLKGEAFGEFLRILKWVGTRKDMIVQMFDEVGRMSNFTTIYGRFERSPSLDNPKFSSFGSNITFRESL